MMKFYSLYVCDHNALMQASMEVLNALSFNYESEVASCPLNIELVSLMSQGKPHQEIYDTICAHHQESRYDLFWSAAIFSPLTALSNEQHQAVVIRRLIDNYPNEWRNLVLALQLHPAAKAIVDAAS
jgi:hypothetical protein